MPAVAFVSTRNAASTVSLSEAIARGLAPDGGLFLPQQMPTVNHSTDCDPRRLPSVARVALAGFFEGDAALDAVVARLRVGHERFQPIDAELDRPAEHHADSRR